MLLFLHSFLDGARYKHKDLQTFILYIIIINNDGIHILQYAPCTSAPGLYTCLHTPSFNVLLNVFQLIPYMLQIWKHDGICSVC